MDPVSGIGKRATVSFPPVPPFVGQTRELLQFLRVANDANRTAVRNDAEANRKLLLDTVKIVSIPVAVLIAVAAWFGFRSRRRMHAWASGANSLYA